MPPGLAVCSLSEPAFAKAETVKNRGTYFDFLAHRKSGQNNEHPVNTPYSTITRVKASVEKILANDPETHYARHDHLTQMIREWAVR